MMQRDEFINTLKSASVLVMLGVKALIVIIFVFSVLTAGLNYQNMKTTAGTIINPVVETIPLPNVAYGYQEMVVPTPLPTLQIPHKHLLPQLHQPSQ